eukprot:gnl/Dysnectes_brevis/401_a443_4618.p1 GENE.gnl/Dysnectes_brevis/401_a443_4618~~gnl/Dysnectes_brevis/401_a443_4618.p1  ORF type:complete len:1557 (+),score=184.73 gnl/Dysnectes_brevis/401_a443_4618:57-4727(+)
MKPIKQEKASLLDSFDDMLEEEPEVEDTLDARTMKVLQVGAEKAPFLEKVTKTAWLTHLVKFKKLKKEYRLELKSTIHDAVLMYYELELGKSLDEFGEATFISEVNTFHCPEDPSLILQPLKALRCRQPITRTSVRDHHFAFLKVLSEVGDDVISRVPRSLAKIAIASYGSPTLKSYLEEQAELGEVDRHDYKSVMRFMSKLVRTISAASEVQAVAGIGGKPTGRTQQSAAGQVRQPAASQPSRTGGSSDKHGWLMSLSDALSRNVCRACGKSGHRGFECRHPRKRPADFVPRGGSTSNSSVKPSEPARGSRSQTESTRQSARPQRSTTVRDTDGRLKPRGRDGSAATYLLEAEGDDIPVTDEGYTLRSPAADMLIMHVEGDSRPPSKKFAGDKVSRMLPAALTTGHLEGDVAIMLSGAPSNRRSINQKSLVIRAKLDSCSNRSMVSPEMAKRIIQELGAQPKPRKSERVYGLTKEPIIIDQELSVLAATKSPEDDRLVFLNITFQMANSTVPFEMLFSAKDVATFGFIRVPLTRPELAERTRTGYLTDYDIPWPAAQPIGKGEVPKASRIPTDNTEEAWPGGPLVAQNELNLELMELLRGRKSVFNPALPTDGSEFDYFSIDVVDGARSYATSYRRYPPLLEEEIHTQVMTLLADGFIRRSQSGWAHQVHMVTKPDASWRMTINYKPGINAVTVPLSTPMPNIEDIKTSLRGMRFFGSIDLRQGYYQALIHPDDRHKTAFVTKDGLFEWIRLAFGLKNAPPWFQMQMGRAFGKAQAENRCRYWVDDVLVIGETKKRFMENLAVILDIVDKWKLVLKAPKCVFGVLTVDYIGLLVSEAGISISPNRTRALRELPAPKSKKQVESFLGMAGYYRAFIPDFAAIVKPLTVLTKGGAPFVWSEDAEDAFHEIKEAIASPQCLAHMRYDWDIILKTDASKVGVGAVLEICCPDTGVCKPVVFISKTLNDTQQRWTINELEAYAIIYAVTQLNPYLIATSFEVHTDHRNLLYIARASSSKVRRWNDRLSEYSFTIRHIPGRDNTTADVMSRFIPSKTADLLVMSEAPVSTLREKIIAAQTEHSSELEAANCTLSEGVWMKNGRIILLPAMKSLIEEIISFAHGPVMSGHRGVGATLDYIREKKLSWPQMQQSVSRFIRHCMPCQKTRLRKFVSHGLGNSEVTQPFHTVAIDTIGPLGPDRGPDDYKYIIVMVDCFTRWCEIVPSKRPTAEEAAEALVGSVYSRHGLPRRIRSDNGTQYVNKLLTEIHNILAIDHPKILAYRPQSNGVVERANGEVVRHIRGLMYELSQERSWTKLLPLVSFLMNTTKNRSIGSTPYAMLHGNHLSPRRGLLDGDVIRRMEEGCEDEVQDFTASLTDNVKSVHDAARKVQAEAVLERQKDAEVENPSSFEVGEYVLLTYFKKRPHKLGPTYRGPMKVSKVIGPLVYEVECLVAGTKLKLHVSRLRKFVSRAGITEAELRHLASKDAEGEFLVDRVVDHRVVGVSGLEFLVHWDGYEPSEDTWEPLEHVDGAHQLEDYLDMFPDLRVLVRDERRRLRQKKKKD